MSVAAVHAIGMLQTPPSGMQLVAQQAHLAVDVGLLPGTSLHPLDAPFVWQAMQLCSEATSRHG
jgi:hypothetical protein